MCTRGISTILDGDGEELHLSIGDKIQAYYDEQQREQYDGVDYNVFADEEVINCRIRIWLQRRTLKALRSLAKYYNVANRHKHSKDELLVLLRPLVYYHKVN
jgi:hypothetical protein